MHWASGAVKQFSGFLLGNVPKVYCKLYKTALHYIFADSRELSVHLEWFPKLQDAIDSDLGLGLRNLRCDAKISPPFLPNPRAW